MEWRNPNELKLINLQASKWKSDSESIANVIGRDAVRCLCDEDANGYIIIDFKTLKIKPTAYTLRHYISWDIEALRNWNFEGSNNGIDWTIIKQHKNDENLNKKGKSYTWKIRDDLNESFQMFRIQMTSENSNGNYYLCCSGFEIYGRLIGIINEPKIVEKTFKYEKDFDENGIIYFLGCDYGKSDWQNPSIKGL
eukprot:420657_1